jgi:hypothetical protein
MPTQFIESVGFTLQEIAELSEILRLQKNARALVSSSAELTQERGRLC